MIVDQIQTTVAHTDSVDSYLVGSTGHSWGCHHRRTLRTVKYSTISTSLTNSTDPVISVKTNTGGSVEESIITTGRSFWLTLADVGVVDIT